MTTQENSTNSDPLLATGPNSFEELQATRKAAQTEALLVASKRKNHLKEVLSERDKALQSLLDAQFRSRTAEFKLRRTERQLAVLKGETDQTTQRLETEIRRLRERLSQQNVLATGLQTELLMARARLDVQAGLTDSEVDLAPQPRGGFRADPVPEVVSGAHPAAKEPFTSAERSDPQSPLGPEQLTGHDAALAAALHAAEERLFAAAQREAELEKVIVELRGGEASLTSGQSS